MMKRVLLAVVALGALYAGLVVALALVMLQPPERFGKIMTKVPEPLVWGLLPGPTVWLWARSGALVEGGQAPDFTLPTVDGTATVTLSSHRGVRPVVLVFGSYT